MSVDIRKTIAAIMVDVDCPHSIVALYDLREHETIIIHQDLFPDEFRLADDLLLLMQQTGLIAEAEQIALKEMLRLWLISCDEQ